MASVTAAGADGAVAAAAGSGAVIGEHPFAEEAALESYASLRDVCLEKVERIRARFEVLEERIKAARGGGGGGNEGGGGDSGDASTLYLVQEAGYGIDEELRDLLAFVPEDEGDEVFKILAPTSTVHRLQQQVSVMKQRVVNLQLALSKKDVTNQVLCGRFNRKAKLIEHMRNTLYREVCLLREELKLRTGYGENADVGVFSLFDIGGLCDLHCDVEGGDDAEASAVADLKKSLEHMLCKWKHEEGQRVDSDRRRQDAVNECEAMRRRCELLEDNMKELSARFSDEFIQLKTERISNQLVIRKTQERLDALQKEHGITVATLENLQQAHEERRLELTAVREELAAAELAVARATEESQAALAKERAGFAVELRAVERRAAAAVAAASASGSAPLSGVSAAAPAGRADRRGDEDDERHRRNEEIAMSAYPLLVTENKTLQAELDDARELQNDWREECHKVTLEHNKLEHRNFSLVSDLEELRETLEQLQQQRRTSAGPSVQGSLREARRDLKLLTRKVVLLCEKYDAMLAAFEVEDQAAEAAVGDGEGDGTSEAPASLRRPFLPLSEDGTPLGESDAEVPVEAACQRLEELDRRLRGKLARDRAVGKTALGAHNRIRAVTRTLAGEFDKKLGRIRGVVGEEVFRQLNMIGDGDGSAAARYSEQLREAEAHTRRSKAVADALQQHRGGPVPDADADIVTELLALGAERSAAAAAAPPAPATPFGTPTPLSSEARSTSRLPRKKSIALQRQASRAKRQPKKAGPGGSSSCSSGGGGGGGSGGKGENVAQPAGATGAAAGTAPDTGRSEASTAVASTAAAAAPTSAAGLHDAAASDGAASAYCSLDGLDRGTGSDTFAYADYSEEVDFAPSVLAREGSAGPPARASSGGSLRRPPSGRRKSSAGSQPGRRPGSTSTGRASASPSTSAGAAGSHFCSEDTPEPGHPTIRTLLDNPSGGTRPSSGRSRPPSGCSSAGVDMPSPAVSRGYSGEGSGGAGDAESEGRRRSSRVGSRLLSLRHDDADVLGAFAAEKAWWRERVVCVACGYSMNMGDPAEDDVTAADFVPKWLLSLHGATSAATATAVATTSSGGGGDDESGQVATLDYFAVDPKPPQTESGTEAVPPNALPSLTDAPPLQEATAEMAVLEGRPSSGSEGAVVAVTKDVAPAPAPALSSTALLAGENLAELTPASQGTQAGSARVATSAMVLRLNRYVEDLEKEMRARSVESGAVKDGSQEEPFATARSDKLLGNRNVALAAEVYRQRLRGHADELDAELVCVVRALQQCAFVINAEALLLHTNRRVGNDVGTGLAAPRGICAAKQGIRFRELRCTPQYAELRDALARFQRMLSDDTVVGKMDTGVAYVVVTPHTTQACERLAVSKGIDAATDEESEAAAVSGAGRSGDPQQQPPPPPPPRPLPASQQRSHQLQSGGVLAPPGTDPLAYHAWIRAQQGGVLQASVGELLAEGRRGKQQSAGPVGVFQTLLPLLGPTTSGGSREAGGGAVFKANAAKQKFRAGLAKVLGAPSQLELESRPGMDSCDVLLSSGLLRRP